MADESDKSVAVWCPRIDARLSSLMSELTVCCLLHNRLVVSNLHHCMKRDGLDFTTPLSGVDSQIFRDASAFYEVLATLEQEHVVEFLDLDKVRIPSPTRPASNNTLMQALAERCRDELLRQRGLTLPFDALGKRLQELQGGSLEHTRVMWDLICSMRKLGPQLVRTGFSYMVLASYSLSLARRLPLTVGNTPLPRVMAHKQCADVLPATLARSAISQLVLPNIKAISADDLLHVRTKLRDELLDFQAGILDLSYLLHQQVRNGNDLKGLRQEADVLVNTKITAAVMSLENRMRQHENKRIRRMLFGTGRVLVDAAKMFLPGGWQEKLVAGGKTLLQTATEMDSAKPPEDQIATYLYKLKRRLKS